MKCIAQIPPPIANEPSAIQANLCSGRCVGKARCEMPIAAKAPSMPNATDSATSPKS